MASKNLPIPLLISQNNGWVIEGKYKFSRLRRSIQPTIPRRRTVMGMGRIGVGKTNISDQIDRRDTRQHALTPEAITPNIIPSINIIIFLKISNVLSIISLSTFNPRYKIYNPIITDMGASTTIAVFLY